MKFNRDDSTSFKVRMSMDLRMELGKIAQKNNMTLYSLVNIVLQEYVGKSKNVKK